MWEREKDIEKAFKEYFDGIYTTSHPRKDDIDLCIRAIKPRMTETMNSKLHGGYSKGEVEAALQ